LDRSIPLGGRGIIAYGMREVSTVAETEAGASGTVYISPELESNLQDRLSRIEGHVRGIERMLAEHRDCDDILSQVSGAEAAMNQVAILLLEGHLETCVVEASRSGNGVAATERFKGSLSRVLK